MPKPFAKWVGGKTKLLPQLTPLLPDDVETMRHIEPFLGGGALFFARTPAEAVLSDINMRLINTYAAIRDDVEETLEALQVLAAAHSLEHFYKARNRFNGLEPSTMTKDVEQAALFVYLNKTCFNGVYRENRSGEFNVPADLTKKVLTIDEEGLRASSKALQTAELYCSRFESVAHRARTGDFVYFDPPYEPVSKTSNFTTYAQGGFGREDQQTLRYVFGELDKRRCNLMLSNSDSAYIRELYADFNIDVVTAARSINSDGKKRGHVNEIVVRNY